MILSTCTGGTTTARESKIAHTLGYPLLYLIFVIPSCIVLVTNNLSIVLFFCIKFDRLPLFSTLPASSLIPALPNHPTFNLHTSNLDYYADVS